MLLVMSEFWGKCCGKLDSLDINKCRSTPSLLSLRESFYGRRRNCKGSQMKVERIKSVIQIKDIIPFSPRFSTLFHFPARSSSKCECVTHLNGNVSVAETRNGFGLAPFLPYFLSYFSLSPALIVSLMCVRVCGCHNTFLHLPLAFLCSLFMHSVHLFFIYCLCVLDICISLSFCFLLHTFERRAKC